MTTPPSETPFSISLKQLIEAADWGADALNGLDLQHDPTLARAHEVLQALVHLHERPMVLTVPHVVLGDMNPQNLHGATFYLTAEGARIHVALVSWDSSDNAPVPVALLP